MSNQPSKLFSLKEFSEINGHSLSHTYNLIAAGKIKAIKNGSKTQITAEEAARYQASLPAMVSRARPPKSSRAA